tara:strand:+ start:16432 stop:18738 length:2307 start_codon:yes stop_codon:yes gene_type:complete
MQEAETAAAAVETLGVNSERLKKRLQGVSAQLKGQISETTLLAASYDVASAGFNNAASASDILKAASLGAKGGLSDLNTVANATTSVLNAYGLSSDKASKLVDGFIQTQNDGKIIVAQYAAQIGRVAPTAAAAGVGIDELNAAISAVTATGVPVESTFAGIRQVIAGVIKPTSEASKRAKELGIEFSTAAIKQKGFAGFLKEVIDKTGGSEAEISQLFGSVEALTAIMPLVNDRLGKFNQALENQQNSSGAAESAFNKLTDTVSGQTEALANNLGGLARVFDKVFGPGLKDLLTEVNAQISAFTRFIRGIDPEAIKAAVSMAGFAAKIFVANKAFILLQKTATFTFAKRIIPLLVSTKAKLVTAKLATASLAGTMRLLKTAIPFGFLLVGLDLVISKLIEASGAQRDLNNLLEFGTEKQLEQALATQTATRALLENTLETLRNKAAKAAEGETGFELISGADEFAGEIADLERKLAGANQTIVDISMRLMKLSADRRKTAAETKSDIDALLKQLQDAATGGADPGDDRTNQLAALAKALELAKQDRDVAKETDEAVARRLQNTFDLANLKYQFPALTKEELEPLRKVLQETFNLQEAARGREDKEKDIKKVLTEQEKLFQRIGQTISDGIVDGLLQAKSAGEALNNVLQNTARQLLQIGTNTLLKAVFPGSSLFSALPGFANGGSPPVGKPSIVGEKGPELFVPRSAGTILPNGVGMGSTTITVNVSAGETSADSSNGQGASLGKAIGLAVQLELIKQKRPGGLLATV